MRPGIGSIQRSEIILFLHLGVAEMVSGEKETVFLSGSGSREPCNEHISMTDQYFSADYQRIVGYK